jgi:Glycosyl hydrolases family 16
VTNSSCPSSTNFDRVYINTTSGTNIGYFQTGPIVNGVGTASWNTAPYAGQTLELQAIAWDQTGNIFEGESPSINVVVSGGPTPTVANSNSTPTATPTPQPTGAGVTPTAQPTSPPASGLQPFGSVAPPSGQTWHVTFDDEFSTDGGINTGIWNGAAGGGNPLCHPGGTTDCGWTSNPTSIADCIGFAGNEGGDECAEIYGGTLNGIGFGVGINGGVGLAVQAATQGSPDSDYFGNAWAGVQNYGKFSQVYGFYEWSAKLPTDVSGEGDGWHTDLWCTANQRTTLQQGDQSIEFDVNEHVGGTGNRNWSNFTVWDSGNPSTTGYGVPGGGNLDDAFHTYGLYWRNDGSGAFGSMQLYVDGSAASGTVPVNDPLWGGGVYCFGGWMQQTTNPFQGGSGVDGSTSNNNPLLVQYFRAWQAQ